MKDDSFRIRERRNRLEWGMVVMSHAEIIPGRLARLDILRVLLYKSIRHDSDRIRDQAIRCMGERNEKITIDRSEPGTLNNRNLR